MINHKHRTPSTQFVLLHSEYLRTMVTHSVRLPARLMLSQHSCHIISSFCAHSCGGGTQHTDVVQEHKRRGTLDMLHTAGTIDLRGGG